MRNNTLTSGIAVLLTFVATVCVGAEPRQRVEVHLYGGDVRDGAPLAAWYRSIGVTDVWLYPVKGAFPQDQDPKSQRSASDLAAAGTLDSYRKNNIRYWWFERPVPDFAYMKRKKGDSPRSNLWDSSAETDAIWSDACHKMGTVYAKAREAGFRGIVYDAEAYYSYQGDEQGKQKPWVWGGHDDQYGLNGNYYRRGFDIGKAISAVWPDAKVIVVYAFGYPGEHWWCRGIQDAGVDLYLGNEHTYGAGQPEFGNQVYHSWWGGKTTKEVTDWKRTQFSFIPDNKHIMAGLFPIDFGSDRPNYRAKYFREQLASAATDDPNGPIPVWIWPQGEFSPASWKKIQYAPGESSEDYFRALRDYSQAFPPTQQ